MSYPAAVYPMGESWKDGTQHLAKLIRSRPGKFILMGHSQGGAVISNILDELRYGTLQDRYDDLLLGVGIGNMRRQKHSTAFDDPQNFGGNGFGSALPTLKATVKRLLVEPATTLKLGMAGARTPLPFTRRLVGAVPTSVPGK